MEDILKRLLETESRAEAIIQASEVERDRIVDTALEEAHQAEVRFLDDSTRSRQPLMQEAEDRSNQMVADLTRKYEARQRVLRDQADRNEGEAVKVALELLLDPEV
jgi:vacuolar-type H+-ATPase subunit H